MRLFPWPNFFARFKNRIPLFGQLKKKAGVLSLLYFTYIAQDYLFVQMTG